MKMFASKVIFVFAFLFSGLVNASVITGELEADDFITYKDIDWAWASSVNVQNFYDNVLYLPTAITGWRFATDFELNILRTELSITNFTGEDEFGNDFIIQATEYWNSLDFHVDITDFNAGNINSSWTADMANEWYFETFYVRDSFLGTPVSVQPTPVTEPGVLLIFSLSLIMLSRRKSVYKKS